MGKPAKKKRLPKDAEAVERLTDDEVMEAVFGKRGQKRLRKQARPDEPTDSQDDAESTLTT